MIEAQELTKRYDDTITVHSLSFTIAPGTVTGVLAPNGAGKSTTMRMIIRPGPAGVGHRHRQRQALPAAPCSATRARPLLEASAVRPGRSARSHLRSTTATHTSASRAAYALAPIMATAVTLHRRDA